MSFLVFQDRQGLVIWPLRHVAMVREEFAGRVEALSADGEVVFRPGPLVPGPPLVAVAPGTFVNPAHAQERHGELHLPGGWRVQGALPPGPTAQDPPEDPVLPEVGVRASQVLYLEVNRRTSIWWTDSGPLEPPELRRRGLKGRAQAALHPDLRPAGRDWFVNPLRLRFLRRRPPTGFLAGFDNGATVPLGRMGGPGLAASLGLADPDLPAPETPTQFGLRLVGLRRWPQRLADAPAEFLRREFEDDPARLLANLVGQTHDAQRLGESTADGHAHRPYYYIPTRATLYRAGHLALSAMPPELDEVLPLLYETAVAKGPLTEDEAWILMCRVLARLVGEIRFCTYRELGFRDLKPQYRLLGPDRPHVVVLVEKEALFESARELHRRFGVTVLVSGGVPTLVGTEFLCESLASPEVLLLSYCDWDPVGWDMPVIFGAQFERYGKRVAGLHRLVTPDAFTPDERRQWSTPLPDQGPQWRSRLARWLRETGGVDGQPRALLAHLLPLERLARRLEAFSGGGGQVQGRQ